MNRRAHRVSHIETNLVLDVQYLITIMEVVLGIIFWGEVFAIKKITGRAVILIGVYLARCQ